MRRLYYSLLFFVVLFTTTVYAQQNLPTSMQVKSTNTHNSTEINFEEITQELLRTGEKLVEDYRPENSLKSSDGFASLYFDVYEGKGMENAVAALSPTNNLQTEHYFSQLIQASALHQPVPVIEQHWQNLAAQLTKNLKFLSHQKNASFFETLIQALMILLREGLEALLIIVALLAYLERAQLGHHARIIYIGMAVAIVASFITAYIFSQVLDHLGSSREGFEGIIMLIASAILLYVSYWLFAHGAKRKHAVQKQINQIMSTGKIYTLGFTAFLAIYREGAETVLFYHALQHSQHGNTAGLWAGFLLGCVGLGVIYYVIRRATFKIPYRLFFGITACFLYYMAFSFIGGGIRELQEARWVGITPIAKLPEVSLLGIYPSLESISAQLLFLLPTLIGLIWWMKKNSMNNNGRTA